jgi:hypothetical protein
MSKIIDLVSLASIVPPPNHEVSGGFNAIVNGKEVRVRAVLERTVVIEHQEGGERSVVRKDNCMVKPSAVAFVPGNPNNAAVAEAAGQATGDAASGPLTNQPGPVWFGAARQTDIPLWGPPSRFRPLPRLPILSRA